MVPRVGMTAAHHSHPPPVEAAETGKVVRVARR